eukprot:1567061-Prymnesium_polylepis.1
MEGGRALERHARPLREQPHHAALGVGDALVGVLSSSMLFRRDRRTHIDIGMGHGAQSGGAIT